LVQEHALHGDVDARTGKGTSGVSGRFKSIVKHGILGVWQKSDLYKKRAGRS